MVPISAAADASRARREKAERDTNRKWLSILLGIAHTGKRIDAYVLEMAMWMGELDEGPSCFRVP